MWWMKDGQPHIYAASSIYWAIESIDDPTVRGSLRRNVTDLRRLPFNPANANKDLAKLLVRSTFSNIFIRHDVISDSISPNPSNGSLITSENILQILKKILLRISAILYTQKDGTADIFPDLLKLHKETAILVIEARKLTELQKHKSEEFQAELTETHINENLELQWLRTVLAHAIIPKALTTMRRGKKKPHRY